jgi:hypothetical protein
MAEPGVFQKFPRSQFMVLYYEYPARQDAERAFQHAHILIEHQRTNTGAFQ